MNTESNTAIEEEVTAAPKFALIHTRNEEDEKSLLENFDITKLGNTRLVRGLTVDTQTALSRASAKGTRIVSTGLPLDIGAKLRDVTIVRCWASRTNDDGSKRAGGSMPPSDYFASQVIDKEAYELLKTSPVFAKAFGIGEEAEGDEAF